MVSGIGGSNAALSLLARVKGRKTQEAGAAQAAAQAGTAALAPNGQVQDSGAAVTRSAQSDAVDRLGAQLDAQADAARVQAGSGEGDAAASAEGAGDTAAASGPAAGAAGAAGGAASSSDSESTDYIAEADTNNDRKVSDQERIAYEKKLAQQAEQSAQAPRDAEPAQRGREQEVRQAYAPQAAQASIDVAA
ncbi:MAG: hypothetical protein AB1584_13965 [Pseudomonadota bacterium]